MDTFPHEWLVKFSFEHRVAASVASCGSSRKWFECPVPCLEDGNEYVWEEGKPQGGKCFRRLLGQTVYPSLRIRILGVQSGGQKWPTRRLSGIVGRFSRMTQKDTVVGFHSKADAEQVFGGGTLRNDGRIHLNCASPEENATFWSFGPLMAMLCLDQHGSGGEKGKPETFFHLPWLYGIYA